MRRTTRRFLLVAVPATAALVLGGCSSSQSRLAEVRTSLTPELYTATMTKDEADNRGWISIDRGIRDMRADFLRIWHADRPSRLSPAPVAY